MKKLFKAVALNKNQNGFSLVEIMVAAGMLGVVSLGVMRLTSNMSKSSKKLYQEAESQDLRNRIKGLLSSQSAGIGTGTSACFNTLNGLTLSAAGATFNDIRDKDNNVVMSDGDIIGAGTPGALTITDIRIRGFATAPSNPRTYSTTSPLRTTFVDATPTTLHQGPIDLQIQVRKTSNASLTDAQIQANTLGGATKTILIPLNVVTDTSFVVQDCFGNQNEYISAACAALGGSIDGNGRCTEIHIFTGAGNTASGVTATNIGSGLSTDASIANRDTTALRILRNDNRLNLNSLIIDNDEIQAIKDVGSVATPGDLKLNEEGGTVEFGSGDNIAVGISGTLEISGNTTIGDASTVDVATVNSITNINGATTIDADLSVNGNTILGNEDTDTQNIRGVTRLIGPQVHIGNGAADIVNLTGVTTLFGPTITVGNQNSDSVTVQGTTILRGNSITVGDATSDTVVINGTNTINGNTTFTGSNVTIGDASSDVVTINGTTNLNGNTIRIGNANGDTITVRGGMTLTPTPSGNASDSTVPNLGTVRAMMTNVLAPSGTEFAGVLADIISNGTANDVALNVQSEWTCDKIRIRNKSGAYTTNGGSNCDFDTPDTRCDVSGTCSQVCIGTACRSSWPSSTVTVTTSCTYPEYIFSYSSVNPSNSNAGSGGALNYNCGGNRVVVGTQRQYMRFACGSHGWRSRLKCCTLSL